MDFWAEVPAVISWLCKGKFPASVSSNTWVAYQEASRDRGLIVCESLFVPSIHVVSVEIGATRRIGNVGVTNRIADIQADRSH